MRKNRATRISDPSGCACLASARCARERLARWRKSADFFFLRVSRATRDSPTLRPISIESRTRESLEMPCRKRPKPADAMSTCVSREKKNPGFSTKCCVLKRFGVPRVLERGFGSHRESRASKCLTKGNESEGIRERGARDRNSVPREASLVRRCARTKSNPRVWRACFARIPTRAERGLSVPLVHDARNVRGDGALRQACRARARSVGGRDGAWVKKNPKKRDVFFFFTWRQRDEDAGAPCVCVCVCVWGI